MGESIIVSSGKGGVGKTHFITNLGVALTRLGKKTAVIDGSLTTPDISLNLNIPFHVRGLSHILKENASVDSASVKHKSGLTIIPGNIHADVLKEIKGRKFARLLRQLKKDYDFVLVDSAAGLGSEALSAIKHCDKMLIVTNPELASVVNSSKAIQTAKSLKVKPAGVILNRLGRFRKELDEAEIAPLLNNVPVIGRLSEDLRLPISTYYSESVLDAYPNSSSSREFYNIAHRLSGMPKKEESFFERLAGFFRRD